MYLLMIGLAFALVGCSTPPVETPRPPEQKPMEKISSRFPECLKKVSEVSADTLFNCFSAFAEINPITFETVPVYIGPSPVWKSQDAVDKTCASNLSDLTILEAYGCFENRDGVYYFIRNQVQQDQEYCDDVR